MKRQPDDHSPAAPGNQNTRATALRALLQSCGTHVIDGAWGTALYARGCPRDVLPEQCNLSNPSLVRDLAREYHDAGAAWVGTNTFNSNPLRQQQTEAPGGLVSPPAGSARDINQIAAQLSRVAVGDNGLVIGTLGPTGIFLKQPDFPPARLKSAFREQAESLLSGGVDALLLETMMDPREVQIALQAVRDLAPVFCTFTFAETAPGVFQTLTGVGVGDAINIARQEGARVVGANCTLDPEGMTRLAPILLDAAQGTPVLVRANAGQPREHDGAMYYPVPDETFANHAQEMRELGVRFVGGCCGTTPDTIRRMALPVGCGPMCPPSSASP